MKAFYNFILIVFASMFLFFAQEIIAYGYSAKTFSIGRAFGTGDFSKYFGNGWLVGASSESRDRYGLATMVSVDYANFALNSSDFGSNKSMHSFSVSFGANLASPRSDVFTPLIGFNVAIVCDAGKMAEKIVNTITTGKNQGIVYVAAKPYLGVIYPVVDHFSLRMDYTFSFRAFGGEDAIGHSYGALSLGFVFS